MRSHNCGKPDLTATGQGDEERAEHDCCCAVQEPPRVCDGGGSPPGEWPTKGTIEYRDVTASYRPGLPPVLRNITFTLEVLKVACQNLK